MNIDLDAKRVKSPVGPRRVPTGAETRTSLDGEGPSRGVGGCRPRGGYFVRPACDLGHRADTSEGIEKRAAPARGRPDEFRPESRANLRLTGRGRWCKLPQPGRLATGLTAASTRSIISVP